MKKFLKLTKVYQLFIIKLCNKKKLDYGNNLQIILKYIEPCFNCECPTCDVNIKKDAVVYTINNNFDEYENYIKKFQNIHGNSDNCQCPNCFYFKYPHCLNYHNSKSKYIDDNNHFDKLLDHQFKSRVDGVYIFSFFSPNYLYIGHVFLLNTGNFSIFRDLEFERQASRKKCFIGDYIFNRNIRQKMIYYEFKEYSSIKDLEKVLINNCQSIDTFYKYYNKIIGF